MDSRRPESATSASGKTAPGEFASAGPRLSVIVPVHNGRDVLDRALQSLRASDLAAAEWELIVVDDASTDGTSALAGEYADAVIRLDGSPRGPAYARNRGSDTACGDILAFIDADVCVHPSTLRRLLEALVQDDGVAAVFGAYDRAPAAPGTVSQYRNLMHHYVHATNAGDADTFWAGCGAIRRADFERVGGFDAQRYPRPQIEDIELGYRLRSMGCRIALRPDIQATHLKRWTLGGMVRSDLLDRGVPWMQLLVERGALASGTLNVRRRDRVLTALAGIGATALLFALITWNAAWLGVAAACAAGIVLARLPFLRWLHEVRGLKFALAAAPLQLLHYSLNVLAVGIVAVRRALRFAGLGQATGLSAAIGGGVR